MTRYTTTEGSRLNQLYNTYLTPVDEEGNRDQSNIRNVGTPGLDYWLGDTHRDEAGNVNWANVENAIAGSHEATAASEGKVGHLGGVNPNQSIAQQSHLPWAGSHFESGGYYNRPDDSNATNDAAGSLNAIADQIGTNLPRRFFATGVGDNGGGNGENGDVVIDDTRHTGLTIDDLNDWWAQQNQNQGGMDDFMKFMMLMSVMGGGGMGGGGYGGSQYGYGGLTPGGVHPSSNSLEHLTGLGSWFQDNFGSGGATTGTVNTGTT